MAELVDAPASNAGGREVMQVRALPIPKESDQTDGDAKTDMKKVPAEIIKTHCLPGNGKKTCRYLVMHRVFCCVKLDPNLKIHLDGKVKQGCLKSKGDNCDGEFKEAV